MIDLRQFFAREARAAVATAASRASAGRGVGGAPLAPLASGERAGPAMAERLRRGRVTATPAGFAVDYAGDQALAIFDAGNARQPARPVVGLTAAERAAIAARARREAARQLGRALRRA